MKKIIIISCLIALTGCSTRVFMPEQRRVAMERAEISRKLNTQKRINADRKAIQQMEQELAEEEAKYYGW